MRGETPFACLLPPAAAGEPPRFFLATRGSSHAQQRGSVAALTKVQVRHCHASLRSRSSSSLLAAGGGAGAGAGAEGSTLRARTAGAGAGVGGWTAAADDAEPTPFVSIVRRLDAPPCGAPTNPVALSSMWQIC